MAQELSIRWTDQWKMGKMDQQEQNEAFLILDHLDLLCPTSPIHNS